MSTSGRLFTPNAEVAYGWDFRGDPDPDPIGHFRWVFAADIACTPSERLVEVPSGGTLLAAHFAAQAGWVVALDTDLGTLSRDRAETTKLGVINIEYQTGSVLSPGLPKRSCDKVVSTMGLHSLARTEQLGALNSLARMVAPGGELHIADFMAAVDAKAAARAIERLRVLAGTASRLATFAKLAVDVFENRNPIALATVIEWGVSRGLAVTGFGGTMPILGWARFGRPDEGLAESTGMFDTQAIDGSASGFDFDRR